jgi:glycine/D-amino acid oxidase-like deaminating enzyme
LSNDVAREIVLGRSVLYESGHIAVYYRIDQHNRMLMGGRGPMRWISDPSDIRYLVHYAERLWPKLKGTRWTHAWNSRLAITTDQYPHLHEPEPGLLMWLGCNGRGVALCTAMGARLARRLADGAEIDMLVTPIKPIPFHGFWRIGVTSKVISGRIRDRLGF